MQASERLYFSSTPDKWPQPGCPVVHLETRPEGSTMTVLKARGWQKGNKLEPRPQNTPYEMLFNHYQLCESHRGVHTPAPRAEATLYPHYAGSHLDLSTSQSPNWGREVKTSPFYHLGPSSYTLVSCMRIHVSPMWLALATPFLCRRRIQQGISCFDSKWRHQNLHSGQPDN